VRLAGQRATVTGRAGGPGMNVIVDRHCPGGERRSTVGRDLDSVLDSAAKLRGAAPGLDHPVFGAVFHPPGPAQRTQPA